MSKFNPNLFPFLLPSPHVCHRCFNVPQFRIVANTEFVKRDSWPELIPKLRLAIQNSDQISNCVDCGWKTVNALTVLQAVVRPFQVLILHDAL